MTPSHFADSNRRPTHYECVALPTELKWHCGVSVYESFWKAPSFLWRKQWSGWEDSNFRPPRPERGALANCATPRSSVLAGTRTLDPLIKSQLLYQLSYQDNSYEECEFLIHYSLHHFKQLSFRTPGGTWTHTPLRARDFKSLVSTIPPPELLAIGHQLLAFGFRRLERKTRLELATPTLARSCSTNWAISAKRFF